MSRVETLTAALSAREDEVLNYQINIDNYRAAMQKIEARYSGDTDLDRAMSSFYEQLKQLHDASVIEREKASIMLEVIRDQLGGV